MRILHIPCAYFPVLGGAELQCQKISEALVKKGHTVQVLTADVSSVDAYYDYRVTPIQLKKTETINGVYVKRFCYRGLLYKKIEGQIQRIRWRRLRDRLATYLLTLSHKKLTLFIHQEIQIFKPDVVMTTPHLVVNVQCVLMAHKKTPFPLVMLPLLHEEDTNWSVELMAKALLQADAVVANTDHEAGRLESAYRVPFKKLFIGGVGVDLPVIDKSIDRTTNVLFLGRKEFLKGIPYLLKAMCFVWKKRSDAKLILAGARSKTWDGLDGLLRKLPAREMVHIQSLDDISEHEKADLLSTCACLVLPSKVESFGTVLVEAWAHCTPVVTLDLPVFRSFVSHKKDGLLVKPDDPEELANAILTLLNDTDLAQAMGRKGKEKVARFYQWEKVADRYLEAYKYANSAFSA